MAKKEALYTPEQEATVRAVPRRCKGPVSKAGQTAAAELLERGDIEGANRVREANRLGCSVDFNEVILQHAPGTAEQPAESREVQCPKCGQTIVFTPPNF